MLQHDFMKYAFMAILVITPLFGIMGTMIVHKKMAFFSDALGHSALTGIAIGVILGVNNVNFSLILFAILFSLILNKIKQSNLVATDTIISVFSSLSIAVGLAILSKGGNFSKYSGLLVGDILSITPKEIGYLIGIFLVTIIFWVLCFNKLHGISIDPVLARTIGIKIPIIENIFVITIAIIVMLSIRSVGILLINALLILPAASSRNVSVNMREYHLFSVIFSMFSGIAGLFISFYMKVATGPMIVIISSILFFSTFVYSRKYMS